MQISGQSITEASSGRQGFALAIDTQSIVSKLANCKEAGALPPGCVVGDLHGGLTFSDAVAAVLESRSVAGWQEMPTESGDVWTVIILNR
jgi:crotonobetainyl-CoA:carnitine CoA-transferase CaiB-like acyl-CoA transferase